MTSFNSIKNIFLLIFFLCSMFVLPNSINAKVDVVGDTKGYLNDNSNGSYYIGDKKNNLGGALDASVKIAESVPIVGGGINSLTFGSANWTLNKIGVGVDDAAFTLFNANPSNPQITDAEFNALKAKLKADNSPLADKITKNDVYRENSSNVSTFVYKQGPGGKDVNIGYATRKTANGKGGNFYTVLKPTVKESAEANEQLNIIDKVQGRPEGTTIKEKNELFNAKAAQELLQQKVDEAEKKVEDLKTVLGNIRSNGGTPQQIAVAQAAIEAAEFERDGALNNRGVNQNLINEKQRQANSYNQPIEEGKCDLSNLTNCVLWPLAILTNVMFKFASFAAYLVGTLFDYSLELSVNSAEFVKKLGVVEITWSFIRDILNMTFIFILLFTAVQILIGNDAKYNARKILTNVVIFAILMNFSLFAAKLMVDGSNIVSLKIYEAMKSSSTDKDSSISLRVMNTVGLTGLYNVSEILTPETLQAEGTCANNPTSLITVSVLGTIFLIILILALGLAAVLFLIRLVNIIFLFIRSPLWVWGYVIPGNESMNKISSKWWSEMKHVLLFPIMYLLQILIAIIVFDKLATIQKDGGSLLSLICNPPVGASGLGSSISLVAVFVIVIMFLMKAISYGVKHVGDGGSETTGKWAGAAANKFAGWQTKMTTGLAKKAGGMSVGAANRGLAFARDTTYGGVKRTSGMLVGAAAGMFNRDGIGKGMAEGFLNPGVYNKEQLAKVTGKAAALTGLKSLASATVSMTESAEKSRKDIYAARTKSAQETEASLQKSASMTYKPYTQKEWEHKNGEIGTDTTKAKAFEEHVKEMLEKQADARLGKGIIRQNNKDRKEHLAELMKKAVTTEMVDGKLKVKINNREVAGALKDIAKYHTTGDGKTSQAITKKGIHVLFRTKKGEARLKAMEKSFEEEMRRATGEKVDKDLEEIIKVSEEKLKNLPDEKVLDEILSNIYSGLAISEITGSAEKYPEIRNFNRLIKRKKDLQKRKLKSSKPEEKVKIDDEIYKLEQELTKQVEVIKKTKSNITEKIIKDREVATKKEREKEKKEEAKDKKDAAEAKKSKDKEK